MMSTYIIAEAGVNHNGDVNLAKKLVDIAKNAGADAVKFQTFQASSLVNKNAPKAAYQLETTACEESQLSMLQSLELSHADHHQLYEYCQKVGIAFMSTPFDSISLRFLTENFTMPYLKIPSGEITNAPFLLELAKTKQKIILSTGMSTLGEIETALGVLAFAYLESSASPCRENFIHAYCTGQELLQRNVQLLHCTTEYPAPFEEVNLQVINTLEQSFGLNVGYSDHTQGIAIPIAAVAKGAKIIEKHFTIDKNMAGPDHRASLEADELAAMITGIRQVERALGNNIKMPSPSEWKNRPVVRKSIVAATTINQGTQFAENNLTVKRPGNNISPLSYWDYLNKTAEKTFLEGEAIE